MVRAKIKELQLQDWGVTWNEIEPSFDRFEYLCGISGKAGNLKGQIQPGGNPFEGPRAREYPNPPMKMPYASALFAEEMTELGFHPFPLPSANLSQAYVNPLGVRMGQCSYCGFCERFGCANYSKASAQTTILPVLMQEAQFRGPHRMRGAEGQSASRRQARQKRHLSGRPWRRI